MQRIITFVYGLLAYLMFGGVFVYMIGFLANVFTPTTVDSTTSGETFSAGALVINIALVLLFGLQHSIMARPTFKRWWTKFVPWPAERSTYVLFTNLTFVVLYWQWRPMNLVIWEVTGLAPTTIMWGMFTLGWLTVLATTFMINHFDLFGLRQVWLYLRGKPYTQLGFVTRGPYKHIRHPLYVGWMMAFWATPTMTAGHLVFALGMSTYILVAIVFEERNLAQFHGKPYVEYRKRTPMFIPRIKTEPNGTPTPRTA